MTMHPKTRRVILDEIDTLDIECVRLERRISRKENRIAHLNQMLVDDDNARTITAGGFVASR